MTDRPTRRDIFLCGLGTAASSVLRAQTLRNSGSCVSWLHNPRCVSGYGLLAYYDFVQGADPQALYDRSGNGHHGQLGSAAGVDVNDPDWGAERLVFGANDYTESSNAASQFTPPTAMSCDIALLVGSNSGHKIVWSVNDGATAYLQGAWRPNGTQSLGIMFGKPYAQLTFNDYFASPSAEPVVLGYTVTSAGSCRVYKNGIYFGQQNHTKALAEAGGTMRLCHDNFSSYNNGGELYGAVWYSRVLTAAEHWRNYAAFKASAARSGVVLP